MWIQLVVSLVMMVISAALQPSVAQAKQATPEAGKLDVPTAEEGGAIQVIFGTVVVKTSNVIWYGDASTTPIKQSSGSGGKK